MRAVGKRPPFEAELEKEHMNGGLELYAVMMQSANECQVYGPSR